MSALTQTLTNGQTINYFESGTAQLHSKPTLLFIHGNFSNWMWWSDTINALKKYDYHIIAVDLRGFGESSYKQPCKHFADWAADLVNFCQLKQLKQCFAIGWSFGGGISMKLAEMAPYLVQKVVLTCSVSHEGLTLPHKGVPCTTEEQIKENPKVKFMESIIETANRQAFGQVFQSLLLTHAKDYNIKRCDHMIDGSMKQKCYVDVIYALAHTDININAIHAKVLMVHGKYDLVVPLESVKSTGEHFKNLVVWDNHAHMIPIEDIERYAELVRSFIQEK